MTKKEALAKFLEIKEEEIEETKHDENELKANGGEYLVLTDDEADQRTADYIRDTIWAFNADFLSGYLPKSITSDIVEMIQEKCEDGNEALRNMVGDDMDTLIDDAIGLDGRGHFLATYDGAEEEEGKYFIYQVN